MPTKKQIARRSIGSILFLLLVCVWAYLIYTISPDAIVERLGMHNGYLSAFLVAVVGGLSTFVPIPYQLIVITLGAGGLNPVLLGIAAGLGLMFGDTTSYLIGYYGRGFVPTGALRVFEKIYTWLDKRPALLLPIAIFLYGAVIPIPNDFIVVPLGLMQFPFWKMALPLALGNIVGNSLLAYFGSPIVSWFV